MEKLPQPTDAYLDIETTGLYPGYSQITVVGIYLTSGNESRVIQLVGDDITDHSLLASLEGVDTIYTYNGSRFDLPFIYVHHKVNIARQFKHCDLMYHCWRKNLYGGLKAVERQLGIERQLEGIGGYEAVRLWWRYINDYDRDALATLLEYNREDVVNLRTLREMIL
jgi:uncharacterized protein YprB with RNaseH-like and TPR domain